MKNIINLMLVMILGVLMIESAMTSAGKSSREMELAESLPSAIEESVQKLIKQNGYKIEDSQELIMDFIEDLSLTLDSDCDFTVEVEEVDVEKGLLSVNVIGKYKHPHGEDASISCSRTVIFDKKQKERKKNCVVKFYKTKEDMEYNKNPYKCYEIQEGDCVTRPINPVSEGRRFKGWKKQDNTDMDFAQPIEESVCFYGVW